MKLLHRRLLTAVALGQFLLLGWDLSGQLWYVWPVVQGGDAWTYVFWVPMSFYFLSGLLLALITTGDAQ